MRFVHREANDLNQKAYDIYIKIRTEFEKLIRENGINTDEIEISCDSLTAEQAIGTTDRTDAPITVGQEVMLQARYKDSMGQAFTDAPATFRGTLSDIMHMDVINDPHARGMYIASLNAVMRQMELTDHTVHCKNMEPKECSQEYIDWLKERYPKCRLALIGYQPWLFKRLSEDGYFDLRVLDLNPDNVGQERFGVRVEHGIDDYEEVVLKWADIVLCTSSVFCNATMDMYIDIGKEVMFFGITGAGPIKLLGLNRHCPKSV